MSGPTIGTVAVVATGVVGRSWARLLAEAGCRTRLYDPRAGQVEVALEWLRESLRRDVADGLLDEGSAEACLERVELRERLADAVADAGWVQESAPEDLEAKRSLHREMDEAAAPGTIIASSTSTLDPSALAAGLPGARRCLVAHPVNPPHVIPAVEVLGGDETDPEVVELAMAFLRSVGQTPVRLRRYVPGFLLNRMQAALVREAIHLVESGAAGVEEVDAVIRDGLGLRWALLGPFGTGDCNADEGIREYLERYADSYRRLMADLGSDPTFDRATLERLGAETDGMRGDASREAVRRWRDRAIRRLRRVKDRDPHP